MIDKDKISPPDQNKYKQTRGDGSRVYRFLAPNRITGLILIVVSLLGEYLLLFPHPWQRASVPVLGGLVLTEYALSESPLIAYDFEQEVVAVSVPLQKTRLAHRKVGYNGVKVLLTNINPKQCFEVSTSSKYRTMEILSSISQFVECCRFFPPPNPNFASEEFVPIYSGWVFRENVQMSPIYGPGTARDVFELSVRAPTDAPLIVGCYLTTRPAIDTFSTREIDFSPLYLFGPMMVKNSVFENGREKDLDSSLFLERAKHFVQTPSESVGLLHSGRMHDYQVSGGITDFNQVIPTSLEARLLHTFTQDLIRMSWTDKLRDGFVQYFGFIFAGLFGFGVSLFWFVDKKTTVRLPRDT